MKQLEIDYFFPLTQQMPLDLDYTKCDAFLAEKEKLARANSMTNRIAFGGDHNSVVSYSIGSSYNPTSLTIDVDSVPITVQSKEKPNFAKRIVYNALGIKWEVK